MILFNPLLDVPGGAQRDQLPRPVPTQNHRGGRGDGGALGDPIRPSLSRIHRERKKQKGSDGRGVRGHRRVALSTGLQTPIERAFSYSAEPMLSQADV